MKEIILRILGGSSGDAGHVTIEAMRFDHAALWPAAAALAGTGAAAAWLAYRRSPPSVTASRRRIMMTLRAGFFLILAILLMQPVIGILFERVHPRALLVAVDHSQSFELRDDGAAGKSRRERALEALGGMSGSGPIAALADDLKIEWYDAGRSLVPVGTGMDAPASAPADRTDLAASLSSLAEVRDPARVAGIVFATDGGHNVAGSIPEDAAAAMASDGLKLMAFGVGPAEIVDVAIDGVELPDTALAGDPLRANVMVSGSEGSPVRVSLRIAGSDVDLGAREAVIGPDGTAEVDLTFVPPAPGDHDIEVSLGAGAADAIMENNAVVRALRVIDSALRVLYIEESPRWEYHFLQTLLLRDDRIDLDILLLDADPELAAAPGSPYRPDFSGRAEDLFAYDLVIFGDVDPDRLGASRVDLIADFVSRSGGALIVIAGDRFTPHAYRGSALDAALPVSLRAATGSPPSGPIRLRLTAAGEAAGALDLTDGASAEAWNRLPPVFWIASVGPAKPAAEILAVREPDGSDSADSPVPVIALHRYGAGELLFVGTDSTWRWRRNGGVEAHERFWGQLVQRMAGHRLGGGARHVTIAAEPRDAAPGDRLTITANVRDAAWTPLDAASVEAVIQIVGRPESTEAGAKSGERLTLLGAPDSPGVFQASIDAPPTGRYRVALPDHPEAAPAILAVSPRHDELRHPVLRAELLKRLASITGGNFFTPETIHALPDAITDRTFTSRTQDDLNLWSAPITFLVLVALLATEWIMRKRSSLR